MLSVVLDGTEMTTSVTGVLASWVSVNTLIFNRTAASAGGVLTITGFDAENTPNNHCRTGGFLMACQASDQSSPWHKFVSSTSTFVGEGSATSSFNAGPSTPCVSSSGFSLKHAWSSTTGIQKIWASETGGFNRFAMLRATVPHVSTSSSHSSSSSASSSSSSSALLLPCRAVHV